MIIYSLISNHGGMLRVVESLESIFNVLPKDFPLKVFIFSNKPPFEFKSDRFVWFLLEDVDDPHFATTLETLNKQVKDYLQDTKVDWIVGDFMTLDFFRGIEAKICYDIHFLGRPFFEALSKAKNVDIMDKFSGKNLVLSLHMQHLFFIQFESRFMRRAKRFLVNSVSSHHSLINQYADVSADKPITYIPVSSKLEEVDEKNVEKLSGLYFHGRFHPQKGIHFLLGQDWSDLPLTMRGFETKYLTEESLDWLNQRGITGLPWTSDSAQIRRELLSHDIVLFPSIYEPWGLSLQEALAMGKICVANTCHSGHEEQIHHGINGFLIDFSRPYFKEEIKQISLLPGNIKQRIREEAIKRSKLGHQDRLEKLKDLLVELNLEKDQIPSKS